MAGWEAWNHLGIWGHQLSCSKLKKGESWRNVGNKTKPGRTCGEASVLETLGMEEWNLGRELRKKLAGQAWGPRSTLRTHVNKASCGGMCFVTPVLGKSRQVDLGGLWLDIQISLLTALQAGEEAQGGNIENEAWVELWPQHTLLHTCASQTHTHRY